MQVVILCGGQGTRLGEETSLRPKPMVEIGGRPILWHIMERYAQYGHADFILCLGYQSEVIKNYFVNHRALNSDFTIDLSGQRPIAFHDDDHATPWRVTLAGTGLYAMTGARIKRIQKYIRDDEFLLTYGDGLADINLSDLLRFHRQHGKIATMTGVHPPARFGEMTLEGNHVIAFNEKPQIPQGFINGGFFVFNRRVFDYLIDDDTCLLEREPLERLARDGQLEMYAHDGFWQCMDTVRDLQRLQEIWRSGAPPWKAAG